MPLRQLSFQKHVTELRTTESQTSHFQHLHSTIECQSRLKKATKYVTGYSKHIYLPTCYTPKRHQRLGGGGIPYPPPPPSGVRRGKRLSCRLLYSASSCCSRSLIIRSWRRRSASCCCMRRCSSIAASVSRRDCSLRLKPSLPCCGKPGPPKVEGF